MIHYYLKLFEMDDAQPTFIYEQLIAFQVNIGRLVININPENQSQQNLSTLFQKQATVLKTPNLNKESSQNILRDISEFEKLLFSKYPKLNISQIGKDQNFKEKYIMNA